MNLVENRDTFTQIRHNIIFLRLIQRVGELDEHEEIIQYINHRIAIVVDFIEDANGTAHVVSTQKLHIFFELGERYIGTQPAGQSQVNRFAVNIDFL